MKQLDTDGSGQVDFNEFKEWWYMQDYGHKDYEWERDRCGSWYSFELHRPHHSAAA